MRRISFPTVGAWVASLLIWAAVPVHAQTDCAGMGLGGHEGERAGERRAVRGQFGDNDFAGDVLFAPGSANLSREAQQRLQIWLECLQSEGIPVFETYIVGHTDITGHPDPTTRRQYNQVLSEARAAAVSSWLRSLGFRAQGEITLLGRGESELLCTPGSGASWTPELHRCNRRVEIFISNVEDFDPQLLAEAYGIRLEWEIDPTRTRFDVGETLAVTATFHHPGGFERGHAPNFTLFMGHREVALTPDRRPVDGENWRATGRVELDTTGRFEVNVAATLGQMRTEGLPRTIEVESPEFGLEWQIEPERARFDVGETLSVTANLNHPGGFERRGAPDFTFHLGERVVDLRPDRQPVDGQNWRATGRVELDTTGRFEVNVAATLGQILTEGRPRTIEVDWPEFGLALQPLWDECPSCDASTASVVVDELPGRGFNDVLPIRLHAQTERIQVQLMAEGLPEGVRLVGPGRISLDQSSSSRTFELTRAQLSAPLVLQAGRDYQPALGERTAFRLSFSHPDSGAHVELDLYLERAHEFSLYSDDSWNIDLATMQPDHHRIAPMVDGQRVRIEPGFELSLEGLPVWSTLRPGDDDNEAWVIDHQLPWWMSPAFVGTEDRTLVANLVVGGSIRASDQFVFSIQSSVPRWRLWLDWLLKVLIVLLVLLWLLGMWRKPRFDKSASITRENAQSSQVVSRPLRAGWLSRYTIPFQPERSKLYGLTWLAGQNRGHVLLLHPKGANMQIDGPQGTGDGESQIMIWPNQAVSMEGRPNRFYYEVR